MHTRRQRDAVAPSVKRDRYSVLRRERSDFTNFGYTAGACYIRLNESHRAAQYKILESISHVQIFTDGDRRIPFFAQNRMAFDIFHEQRFFEPKGAGISERLRSLDADVDAI